MNPDRIAATYGSLESRGRSMKNQDTGLYQAGFIAASVCRQSDNWAVSVTLVKQSCLSLKRGTERLFFRWRAGEFDFMSCPEIFTAVIAAVRTRLDARRESA